MRALREARSSVLRVHAYKDGSNPQHLAANGNGKVQRPSNADELKVMFEELHDDDAREMFLSIIGKRSA